MSSLAAGLAYPLWLRSRWLVISMAIYLAAVAVAIQLFPSANFIGLIGVFPLALAATKLLTMFTLGPADLGVRDSGFPRNMFVLPLRTRSLVFWPVAYGAITMAVLWILAAVLIMRPAGALVPVLWPAALSAAATAWLQAIGWSPFPSPFARIPALALALTPLILLAALARGIYFNNQFVSLVIVTGSLIWIAGAYVFAVQGLARARTGSEGDWLLSLLDRRTARFRRVYAGAEESAPRFRSSFTAQLWHECRRNAIALPVMYAFVGTPMMFLACGSVMDASADELYVVNSLKLLPSQLGLLILVAMLPFFCGLYGAGLGKFDIWGKEEIPAFFAIRPMATSRFVLVKMVGAAIGVLAVWLLMFVMIAIWAAIETSPLNPRQSLVRAALSEATPLQIALAVAVPLGLLVFSYREVINGFWTTLIGRKWIANALGFAMMGAFTVAALLGVWVYKHPDIQALLKGWVPWLVGIAVAEKAVASVLILREIRRLELVPPQTMRNWLIAWVVGCVILFLLLSCFVTPSLMLAAIVVLLMPLARVAAAPLALYYNRHR